MSCVSLVANGLRRLWSPPVSQVRFRFHKDKVAAGPPVRKYGYEEKIHTRGLLPHVKHEKHIPMRQHIPIDHWSEKNALFGQNDYIDIFTRGALHPTQVHYEVPLFLRGFGGNEYQCLLRKRNMLQRGECYWRRPSSWRDMNKRIGYLYKFLNNKTKTFFNEKSRHC